VPPPLFDAVVFAESRLGLLLGVLALMFLLPLILGLTEVRVALRLVAAALSFRVFGCGLDCLLGLAGARAFLELERVGALLAERFFTAMTGASGNQETRNYT